MSMPETMSGSEVRKPLAVRVILVGALAALASGAIYLYAVRGTAMILDMASGLAGMFCL